MLKVERRCCSITSVNRIIPYNKERGRLLIHIPFNEAIASINLPARYGFCTYLASKVIKAAKYIGMNLLQSLYCTHVFIRHQIAFNQRVCFLLASSVNTGCTFLSIRCFKFQLVSDAHELNTFFFELLFQPSPIVSCLHIIRLLINGTNDCCVNYLGISWYSHYFFVSLQKNHLKQYAIWKLNPDIAG